ncbi:MAG: DUF721 domain-containing protein [Fimbriimonadaceae bacterium]|nr:DUF721 domain-containing protein [Fimbriimonadaceae bacterium]QYK56326.1 MAG: DUF721 domain-containing protein [Fimbriimonadaceae bacterium]
MPVVLEQKEVLRAARAQVALRRWEEAVGKVLAEKTLPDRFDQGTLWVYCTGSAWAQELRLHEDQIVEKLNFIAEEHGLFRSIKIGVRPPRRAFSL